MVRRNEKGFSGSDNRTEQSGEFIEGSENPETIRESTEQFSGGDSNNVGGIQEPVNGNTPEQSTTATTIKIKSKRGRPAGSRNKPKETTAQASISENVSVKAPRKKTTKTKSEFMEHEEAVNATEFMLTMIQTVGYSFVGEEALFNDIEKMMLLESVPKMLEKIQISTVERVSAFLYPITALTALTLYSRRVYGSYRQQKQENELNDFERSQIAVNTSAEPSDSIPLANNHKEESVWMKTQPLTEPRL